MTPDPQSQSQSQWMFYKLAQASNKFIACNLITDNYFIKFSSSFLIHIYVGNTNDIVNKHI